MTHALTFISAGAGSGKTYRLTEILRQKLGSGSLDPAGVIATTFTRKAATELRERARAHLLSAGDLTLASQLDQALIGTVNGVCQKLLERFSFEAGLSPDLRVLEEADAKAIIRQCIDEALDDETLKSLSGIAIRMGIERWQDDLATLLAQARANNIGAEQMAGFAKRNVTDLLGLFGAPSAVDLDAQMAKVIGKVLPKLVTAAANSSVKKTIAYIEKLEAFSKRLKTGRYVWSDWTKLVTDTPEKGLSELVDEIRELSAAYLSHPRLQADVRDYITTLFGVSARVLERYQQRKRELGTLDFIDQETLLLKVLDQPQVAETLSEELDLLLVDEFQDTSPVQLALFMKLTRLARETIWVGDVKQAIYGFRGSDSELMNAVIGALPELSGQIDVLDQSWRSRPPLVSLVNRVFVGAFDSIPKKQVELKAQREELSRESAFELWHLDAKNVDQRMDALAQQIGSLLGSGRQIVDKQTRQLRDLRAGDIAVLCRSHTRVSAVVGKLALAGVPIAAGHAGLLARPECVLALACLRRLSDAGDTIATAEILSLGDCQEPEQWLGDRLAYLETAAAPEEWQEAGASAHPLLARIAALRAELAHLTPQEAMERILGSCDLPERVLRWCRTEVEARQRLANLDALIELSATYEDGCRTTGRPASIAGMILWFDKLAAEEADDQPVVAADAVQVMTHHAAKGLEWPVVILLDLESSLRDRYWGLSAESTGSVDVMSPLSGRFIRFRPWPFGKTTKLPLRELAAATPAGKAAQQSAISEERRLLYVSMTRARDLIVFGMGDVEWDDEQWLSVTKAPWLIESAEPGGQALPKQLKIPSAAVSVAAGEPKTPAATQPAKLHWFTGAVPQPERLPLYVSPSSASGVDCRVSDPTPIGTPVVVARGFHSAAVGTAVHAALAAGLGESGPLSLDQTAELLRRHGVAGAVDPSHLCEFVQALSDWISATWPAAQVHPELPVNALTASGQTARGQIDVLVESGRERVILDFKTGPEKAVANSEAIRHYAGQLSAYAELTNALRPLELTRQMLVLTGAGAAVECT